MFAKYLIKMTIIINFMYWFNIPQIQNWTMDTKHEEHIKPVIDEWQLSNSLVNLLGILAPAAFLAILLGHSGTFIEFLFNADYWKIKGPRYIKTQKQQQKDIHFSRWLLSFLSRLKCRNDSKYEIDTVSPRDIWRDGSILCNLVNMIVPGACRDPRLHRLQTPKHGLKLVYEYLDIKPIFTQLELSQKSLTQTQERKFSNYLHKIQQIIRKDNDNINNMKFSSDYVARGMGLVVAQQNKKSTFFIYPIPNRYPNTRDLDVMIKGPCGNNGKITIPSIYQEIQTCQPSTEYKRSLYMSSKLNSISPTLQGSSFLRKLSLSTEDTQTEMDIKVKLSATRVKVSYVPENTGIYEISLITRGCHIVGSPFSVPVELASVSNCCSNDSDSESEQENKHTYRKTKVISRIIDFVDEKMLLQDDGTLVKIDENYASNVPNKSCLKSNTKWNTGENHVNKKTLFKDRILEKPRIKVNTNTEEIIHQEKANSNVEATPITKKSHLEFNNNMKINDNFEQNNNLKHPDSPKDLPNCCNHPDSPEININISSVSASFTKVNVPQILNSKDPTLTSKVQDPQISLKSIPRENVKTENHIKEEPTNKEQNTLKKGFKKMGAISENYDEQINCNISQKQSIDRNNSIVEKQKQFWTEKTIQSSISPNSVRHHPKPPKILKSSFISTSTESNKENQIDTAVLSFEGIVENNIKFFEVKLNPESPTQNKTSFKIDIPKFNLNETIFVKNIEIVTKNQEQNVIQLPSIEERKSKLLNACNKPSRPKRIRNQVCNIKEENNIKDDDCTKLNSLNLEKNIVETNTPNVSIRRKYRFKRAKLFFQSLDKPCEQKITPEKHLGIISIKAESDMINQREETKHLKSLRKSNSDSENAPNSKNEISKLPRSESDPCVAKVSNQRTPSTLSERFQVTGLFKDVLEDSRFIGLPNKKAVVASLASLETNCNPLEDHLNSNDINEIDYFEKRTKKCDQNENNIPGYHKEFPHIPNKNSWKHRSRGNPEITGLIPGRKLLGGNAENIM